LATAPPDDAPTAEGDSTRGRAPIRPDERPPDESPSAGALTSPPARRSRAVANPAYDPDDPADYDDWAWSEHNVLHPIRWWESRGHRWLPGVAYPIALFALWRVVHLAVSSYLGGDWQKVPFYYDGERYMQITLQGYAQPNVEMPNTAFFPGVSWISWPIYQWTHSQQITGQTVATLTALAAFICVWGVSKAWKNDAIARKSVWLMALFPSSLFLWSYYSEGMFIALGAGAVWADKKNRHWIAAACLMGICTTRSVGILVPGIIVLCRIIRQRKLDKWCFIYAGASLVGLVPVLYMINYYTGSPLSFFNVQKDWGRGLSWPWVTVRNGYENLWPTPETIMVPALVSRNFDLYSIPIIGFAIAWLGFSRDKAPAVSASLGVASPSAAAAMPLAAGSAAAESDRDVDDGAQTAGPKGPRAFPMEAWMLGFTLIALPLSSTSLASFNRFVLADWVLYPAYATFAARLPPWWRRAFWVVVVVALAVTTYHLIGRVSVDRFIG